MLSACLLDWKAQLKLALKTRKNPTLNTRGSEGWVPALVESEAQKDIKDYLLSLLFSFSVQKAVVSGWLPSWPQDGYMQLFRPNLLCPHLVAERVTKNDKDSFSIIKPS